MAVLLEILGTALVVHLRCRKLGTWSGLLPRRDDLLLLGLVGPAFLALPLRSTVAVAAILADPIRVLLLEDLGVLNSVIVGHIPGDNLLVGVINGLPASNTLVLPPLVEGAAVSALPVVLDGPGLRGVLFAHAAKVRTEKALSSIIRVPRNKRMVLVRDVHIGDTVVPLTVSFSHLLGDRVVYLRDVHSSSKE